MKSGVEESAEITQHHTDHFEEEGNDSVAEELEVCPVSDTSDIAVGENVDDSRTETVSQVSEERGEEEQNEEEADRGDDELEIIDHQSPSRESRDVVGECSRRSSAASTDTVLESPRKKTADVFEPEKENEVSVSVSAEEEVKEQTESVEEEIEIEPVSESLESDKNSDGVPATHLPDVVSVTEQKIEKEEYVQDVQEVESVSEVVVVRPKINVQVRDVPPVFFPTCLKNSKSLQSLFIND